MSSRLSREDFFCACIFFLELLLALYGPHRTFGVVSDYVVAVANLQIGVNRQ